MTDASAVHVDLSMRPGAYADPAAPLPAPPYEFGQRIRFYKLRNLEDDVAEAAVAQERGPAQSI